MIMLKSMKHQKRVCLVRPKPDGENREGQFLDGIVSLGYPDLGDLRVGNEIKSYEKIFEFMKVYKEHNTSLSTTQVYNFATLPVGSIVVTPSIKTRDLHLLEIIKAYFFEESAIDDGNPHQLGVKHLKTVSRAIFSTDFQKMLNAAKKAVTEIRGQNAQAAIAVAYGDDAPLPQVLPLEIAQKIEQALLAMLESNNPEIRTKAALELLERGSEESKLRAIQILTF